MTEKNYVVNVKNKQGTIITFRGDTALELNENIGAFINAGLEFAIGNVEAIIAGASTAPVTVTPDPIAVVQGAFPGAQVTSVTPTQSVAPAVQSAPTATVQGSAPACRHGQMAWVDPANKPWKGWFCPQPKEATDKCTPQFVK
jgi:hypothetical protein